MTATSTLKTRVGEVVLVNFPYDDNAGYKIRPALVKSVSRTGKTVEVQMITTTAPRDKYDYTIKDWKGAGLHKESTLRTRKIARIRVEAIINVLGELKPKDKKSIKKFTK